jgi:peptidoglycan-N-acetylmuramic acid deacetylase
LRKRCFIAFLLVTLVGGVSLSGCFLYEAADLEKLAATSGDAKKLEGLSDEESEGRKSEEQDSEMEKSQVDGSEKGEADTEAKEGEKAESELEDGSEKQEGDSEINGTDSSGESGGNKLDISNLRDYSSISTKKYSWYIVRNNDHKISGCDESISLAKYDAYYVEETGESSKSDKKEDADKTHKADKTGGTDDVGKTDGAEETDETDETGGSEETTTESTSLASTEKNMYLTFDCGYENGYTEQMLDILKAHGAKACFFVTMTYIRDNPEIVKRMKEEGHLVGNHTVHHPSMPEISGEEQREEILECASFMKETTGYDMDMYFRPPSGEYSEQVLQVAKDLGYKTIFWSMAYLDYDVNNQPGADYVVEHFNKYSHPGAIPLIHNVSSSNAEALDQVLTNLSQEGYVFKSLDDMNYE